MYTDECAPACKRVHKLMWSINVCAMIYPHVCVYQCAGTPGYTCMLDVCACVCPFAACSFHLKLLQFHLCRVIEKDSLELSVKNSRRELDRK